MLIGHVFMQTFYDQRDVCVYRYSQYTCKIYIEQEGEADPPLQRRLVLLPVLREFALSEQLVYLLFIYYILSLYSCCCGFCIQIAHFLEKFNSHLRQTWMNLHLNISLLNSHLPHKLPSILGNGSQSSTHRDVHYFPKRMVGWSLVLNVTLSNISTISPKRRIELLSRYGLLGYIKVIQKACPYTIVCVVFIKYFGTCISIKRLFLFDPTQLSILSQQQSKQTTVNPYE